MDQTERFGVSMPAGLLKRFDEAIARAGYAQRSEAIRDIVRDYLLRQEWEHPEAQVVGTITLVYDHHTRDLEDTLTELQHECGECIICSTHVHLDRHNCMEMIAVRGRSATVRQVSGRLMATRGVKHGGLTMTGVLEDEHGHSHG